jgi:hypothetical protein
LEKGSKRESKGTISASKMANKRTQKEALKRNKEKRNKGTLKDTDEPVKNKQKKKWAPAAAAAPSV